MSEYEQELEAWKLRIGLKNATDAKNQDELLMAAEESQSKNTAWCIGCDREMMIRDMRLITRSIDPYMQCDEGETDYIEKANRVRMCPQCFAEKEAQ